MEAASGYNGWKNYPTWAVNLWLTNEEATYDLVLEWAREVHGEHPRYDLAQGIKDLVRSDEPDEASVYSDLCGYALDCVDWYEIADDFLEIVADEQEKVDAEATAAL